MTDTPESSVLGGERRLSWRMPIVFSLAAVLTLMGLSPAEASAKAQGFDGGLAVEGQAQVDLEQAQITAVLLPEQERYAELKTGDDVEMFPLPQGAVEVDERQFRIYLDRKDIPKRYIDDGQVDLSFTAIVPGEQPRVLSAEMSLTAQDNGLWADASEELAPKGFAANSVPETPSLTLTEQEGPGLIESGVMPSSTDAVGSSSMFPCRRIRERHLESRKAWAAVGRTYPDQSDPDAKARMVYSSSRSHSTSFGVGISASKYVDFKASGNVKRKASWGQSFPYTNKAREYQIEVVNGLYERIYYSEFNDRCYPILRQYVWRVIEETGGTKTVNLNSVPKYTNCANVAEGTWTRNSSRGKSFSRSGGLKMLGIIDINLGSKSGFGQEKSYSYSIPDNRKKMCGRSADPAHAGDIAMYSR
ncbi:hypothetical protein [Salininema proteolyticum]|uniref:Uncharacterized protein n=1 Tax=Salininema proteolyticum TaxID=1607685 RepID=A0ABV8TZL2_9ACTN